MALTLNQICGFETGGLEEATNGTTGSPDATEAVIVRSGERSLAMPDATETYDINLFDAVADAGTAYIFGFGIYITAVPTSGVDIVRIKNSSGTLILNLALTSSALVSVIDSTASSTVVSTTALSAGRWHFIEVYFTISGTNDVTELFINDVSEDTDSTGDYLNGAASSIDFRSTSSVGGIHYYDDLYFLSGATASSDRYGSGFSVIPAQIGATDKTSDVEDDASASGGNWVTTGDRPWSDEADGSSITFENTGNLQGAVFFDAANTAGAEGGPSFGSSIVSGTIKGAKYMWRADRGTGSGKTHTLYYGSDNDTTTTLGASNSIANIAGPTSTTPANFFAVSESATIIPAATDNFAMGAGKSATGGQDTYIKEMMACLAHVSSTTVTDLSDGLMPEYPSPGLTVEV